MRIGSVNPVANLAMGIATSFTQNNYMPVQDMAYRTTSAYLMDDWRVTSRLTLNLGVRFDHVGRWYDRQGTGLAVWLPGRYTSDLTSGKVYPGVYWHAIDPGIPVGGSPTRVAFTSPRVGFAWNVQGNGETVVRGGWGQYRWNDQYNDYGGDLSTSQLMATYNLSEWPVGRLCRRSESSGRLRLPVPASQALLARRTRTTITSRIRMHGISPSIGSFPGSPWSKLLMWAIPHVIC